MGSVGNVRTGKGQKSARKLPKRVSEMSKEVLEATLRKKRECNTKALQIVERLVENNVKESWFLDCLKFISDSHYQDVTEERAIIKLCGYPLCPKKLKDIPNQQYHISTKLNKVYDITERKNFCSNLCYKASTYLKQQLLTSPLWLRDKEKIPKFVLLAVHSSGGGVGEEVDIGQSNPLQEELKQVHKHMNTSDFTSVSDFMKSSLSKLSSDIDEAESKERKTKKEILKNDLRDAKKRDMVENASVNEENVITLQSHNEIKENCETDNIKICTESNISANVNEYCVFTKHNAQDSHIVGSTLSNRQDSNSCEKLNESKLDIRTTSELPAKDVKVDDITKNELSSSKETSVCKKQTKTKKKKESKKQSEFVHPMTNAVIHIEKCLHEWFTFESMFFLFGEEKMKEIISDKGECIKEYYKGVENSSWDPKIQEQYMSICRRLNLMELEENKFDNNTQMATKPLPDYSVLKEGGKKMELKVTAFFQGKTTYEDINTNNIRSDTDASNIVPIVLPIVDLHAQKCLRRKIVRDRLNRVVPDILRTFGLSCDITKDVRNLVATFALEAHNINFQPLEWNLIGMIVIKMLAIKDIRLRILLDTEEVTKCITMMLMVFQQDGGYLDRLLDWLTDLDNLLHKQ